MHVNHQYIINTYQRVAYNNRVNIRVHSSGTTKDAGGHFLTMLYFTRF